MLLPAVIPTAYMYTVRLLCHLSCFLMLTFCHLHIALPVRLPASLTLLLYFHAGCRCHLTVRLSYFLATPRLLPAVILLCQSCCMLDSCKLLCHYHASFHCHSTVLRHPISGALPYCFITPSLVSCGHTAFPLSRYSCHCQAAFLLMLRLCRCYTVLLVALPVGLIPVFYL